MEKKRGRPKKYGRTKIIIKKQKVEEEEAAAAAADDELLTNSTDGDGDGDGLIQPSRLLSNASSRGPASPKVGRCQTRYAKVLVEKQAVLNTQSFQNDDGNNSENSTLSLVTQILFGSKRLDTERTFNSMEAFPSKSPVEALEQHKNISPGESIGAQDGMIISSETENQSVPFKKGLDLEKFTADLLAQTQQTELPTKAASSHSDIIMINNNILPEREANLGSNILPAVDNKSSENNELISDHGNPFVDVDGYKVKKELAPLLTVIFRKYGDIAKESMFSMESCSILLELVCSIYKRLEASTFMQLAPSELKSMVGQMKDLDHVKIEIGWLHQRLNQISKAREMFDDVSTLEQVEARTIAVISEKKNAVETYEKELEAGMDAVKKLQERLQLEKDELAMVDEFKKLYGGSLVNGLI